MFLKDKIWMFGVLLLFSASYLFIGSSDVSAASKNRSKIVKAIESLKSSAKKDSAGLKGKSGEAQQHSNRAEISKLNLLAMNEAPTQKVNVLFESNPANSELIINGLYVGSTPVQVPLHRGVHNVKIVSTGHDIWERQIKAYKGLRVYAILALKVVEAK